MKNIKGSWLFFGLTFLIFYPIISTGVDFNVDWLVPGTGAQLGALTVRVGDRIIFQWQNLHNLYLHADNSCNTDGRILLQDTIFAGTYIYTVTEQDAQEQLLHFSCDFNNHCSLGMRMTVVVTNLEPTMIDFSTATFFVTEAPTLDPTRQPTPVPTLLPTPFPTVEPTPLPTPFPTVEPTPLPTPFPTVTPTVEQTPEPTTSPTVSPSQLPTTFPITSQPTLRPTTTTTLVPSDSPTSSPSPFPTFQPSLRPTTMRTATPSESPTSFPSPVPSSQPTLRPTTIETPFPSEFPTSIPSTFPSEAAVDPPVTGSPFICDICPDSTIQMMDAAITRGQTCQEAATAGLSGEIPEFMCNQFQILAKDRCGCDSPSVSFFPECRICQDGAFVNNPSILLTNLDCGYAETAGAAGALSPGECEAVLSALERFPGICACRIPPIDTDSPTISPSMNRMPSSPPVAPSNVELDPSSAVRASYIVLAFLLLFLS